MSIQNTTNVLHTSIMHRIHQILAKDFIFHTISRLLETHSVTLLRKSDTHVVVDTDSVVRVTVFTQTRRQESAVVTIRNGNVTRAGLRKGKKAVLLLFHRAFLFT